MGDIKKYWNQTSGDENCNVWDKKIIHYIGLMID